MGNNQQRVSEKIPTLATCIKKKNETRYRQFASSARNCLHCVIQARRNSWKNWAVCLCKLEMQSMVYIQSAFKFWEKRLFSLHIGKKNPRFVSCMKRYLHNLAWMRKLRYRPN